MGSKFCKLLSISLLSLMVLFCFGELRQAEAKGRRHRKVGIFTRIKRAIKRKIKRIVKKTRRAIVKSACGVHNRIMDGAVRAGSALTGKKPKWTWVKGHYSKGRKHHTKGHWRYVRRHKKSGGGGGGGGGGGAPAGGASVSGGGSLPPIDPVLPKSIQKHGKR